MAESTCAPDAPPSTPSVATMAVATGAAMLAGVVLGRRGLAGLAAGVAAAAGAKLLVESHHEVGETPHHATLTKIDLSPEVEPPQVECLDWVDHDAVVFGHVVPDSAEAMELLKEKSLPLLDDEGLPVEHVTVHPVYPEEPAPDFPLGPVIWEPGRVVQSRSDGTGETVWFGLQDVTADTHPREPQAHALAAGGTEGAVPDSAQTSPVLLAPDFEKTEPADAATGAPPAPANSPFTVESAAPVQGASLASIITARQATKSGLPQPRPAGALPGWLPGQIPHGEQSSPDDVPQTGAYTVSAKSKPRRTRGMPTAGSPAGLHRHLEPVAPVSDSAQKRRWPLILLLGLLLAIGLFFAVDRWQNGELTRRMQALPWFPQQKEVEQAAALQPAPGDPPADVTAKRVPWMNAVPEPGK